MIKQFQRITNTLDKAKKVATFRALNRAAAMTKTQMLRDIRKDSGLTAAQISKRIYTRKASSKSLSSFVSFGVKYGVSLSEFKPKEKIVRIGKGKKARKYRGVSVKLPEGRVTVPHAFMWKSPAGKNLVLARKGSARNPLYSPTFSLEQIAMSHQRTLISFMRRSFEQRFEAQLEYELGKLSK